MKKSITITLTGLVVAVLVCLGILAWSAHSSISDGVQEEKSDILFGINYGCAGFGTVADQTDAMLLVHTDRTVCVRMLTEGSPEVGDFTLSQEDFQNLKDLIQVPGLRKLEVEEDRDVCDGSSYYIEFYDEEGLEVQKLGGYHPSNPEFREVYDSIKSILCQYDFEEAVENYRDNMEKSQ